MTFDSHSLRVVGGMDAEETKGGKSSRRSRRLASGATCSYRQRPGDGWLETAGADGEWTLVCSPISVKALTRDGDNKHWGRLVDVLDPDGRHHAWPMPVSLLAGRGDLAIEQLASNGLRFEYGPVAKSALLRFLQRIHDLEGNELPRALAARRTGWHGTAFVLPSGAVGSREHIVYQSSTTLGAAIRSAGTLEDWQRNIAAPLAGNSRPCLALSLAFAAPLLRPLGWSEGFGIHMRGASSIGKTTVLDAGASVWGGGDPSYRRSWNSTSNGMEAAAAAHNDLPLFLDELADATADDAARVAYQIAGGVGRQRAVCDGSGADVSHWRCVFLSTGETSLDDKIREARVSIRMHAGQTVRMIDVPADAGASSGIFEVVPDCDGMADAKRRASSFAERIASSTRAHYGTAGPEFLRRLIENRETSIDQTRRIIDQLRSVFAATTSDGQVQRVARNFALIGAAGELAISLGILPWQAGEASKSAKTCFDAWRAERGTDGAWETADVVAQLRAVIERHGQSRFERSSNGGPAAPIRDRLGFVREVNGDTEYLVLPEAWKSVMVGRDPRRAAQELAAAGIINGGSDGRPNSKERLPGQRNPQRVFVVSHAALFSDADEAEGTNG